MFSLRTKLIAVLALFVLAITTSSAFIFIREKQQDIAYSTFRNMEAFADLYSEFFGKNYETYYLAKNEVFFQRFVQDIFAKNTALKSLQLTSYDGKILYDTAQKSAGTNDFIKDETVLSQIQSKLPSVSTNSRILFLKKTDTGAILFFDQDDREVFPLGRLERVNFFVFPVLNRYSVLYHLSYELLDDEVRNIRSRILYLDLFGILLGAAFAFFFGSRISRPLQKLVQSASILAQGDLKHRVDLTTGDEFEVLGKAFNSMAEGVEKNLKETMLHERVAKELELASDLQKNLLPKESPKLSDLDIAGGLLPAASVAGDLYDFLVLPDKRFLFYIADVSGHGVPATTIASNTATLFYTLSEKNSSFDLLVQANRILKARTPVNTFVTVGLLEWNDEKKEMMYFNAGHQPLLQFHAADSKVTETTEAGVALGMIPDLSRQIKSQLVDLKPGDSIVLFSDGLSEAWKNEKENYGIARLKRAVSEYCSLSSALAIRNAILSDVKEFTGSYKQVDDMTIIVIKRRSS